MSNLEWVYGIHAVENALTQQPERVKDVRFQEGRDDKKTQRLMQLCKKNGVRFQVVPRKVLDQLFAKSKERVVHQGVVAQATMTKAKDEAELHKHVEALEETPLIIILDGITDPHNLGACLRSADAAGAHAVVMPKDKSAPLNATVSKVACGAAESMPVFAVTNLARTMKKLQDQGVWIFGTAGEATDMLYDHDLTIPTAIVMGAEGDGMRRLTREQCDYLVKLPMAGVVSSLNVSVATGVCLYEAVRQRTNKA
ncbi:23S rRNA (guanosine(2251)-2'-O)-methyltransferase RlmB [Marinomonas mediterranea]|jgi:23S rRNA Gm-2251 2''-O-methyltransferase (EC 2.1.1.-)|uniref:23S rRNA (guanosine-2'-O-)-methyltransferase RlmB n=1 Tax=Marinomonas mediterranea (strain ATCC 700492 / JCM 21426 / NBRC 103028 / MMB-1) TaxID=717774 RepID=F2K2Z3_MARM1|nr:23S rRNA (guanosine(2251)-2'-O)-methyltransferase RlmB [Marinomonas mediterranea]ADZ92382.1 RNA methyltransferase, TrmH family, group 3 [Marinomonas mediterranea MMB-1]WCN10334.1 23S rRNA (guanosine(2251)-2'-O)-methyltransferase RlmB [Marinomonas mediterranea]WCN14379.1 23S rRNA (guanosine(2251)-2'-O)-methyltransferase RlmB [Marinomonas mediterranea]WCN18431.1 23S rRNA (guanosine(2251)-2'-O)-methyltransferase RlmB [Marinomonas mediterranea MMB-1]